MSEQGPQIWKDAIEEARRRTWEEVADLSEQFRSRRPEDVVLLADGYRFAEYEGTMNERGEPSSEGFTSYLAEKLVPLPPKDNRVRQTYLELVPSFQIVLAAPRLSPILCSSAQYALEAESKPGADPDDMTTEVYKRSVMKLTFLVFARQIGKPVSPFEYMRTYQGLGHLIEVGTGADTRDNDSFMAIAMPILEHMHLPTDPNDFSINWQA
jgi:hypothetical protein